MLKTLVCVLACAVPIASLAEPPKVSNGAIVDDEGMTLYTFDKDTTPNQSACAGACTTLWPAALADSYDKSAGDWQLMKAAGGKQQWTYKGRPLYRFAQDKRPGDKGGDGFKGVWHLAKP